MAIPFSCPHCGASSQVADQYAGMTGPCAQCGQQIAIPGAPAAAVADGGAVLAPPPAQRSLAAMIVVLAAVVFMVVVCGGILLALLLPAVQAAREAARRAQCRINLAQIHYALESYHDDFGSYPPAYIPAADGRPMHSWRALLLRYLHEELADEYDFDQPWDSEHNQALGSRMPSVFACPNDPDAMQRHTSYVAIVGPGYFFSGDQPTTRDQVVSPSTTIAVVEHAGHLQINWLEPRDIAADDLGDSVGDRSRPSISSNHIRGANVLMADGSVSYLPDSTADFLIESWLPLKQQPQPYLPAEDAEEAEAAVP